MSEGASSWELISLVDISCKTKGIASTSPQKRTLKEVSSQSRLLAGTTQSTQVIKIASAVE